MSSYDKFLKLKSSSGLHSPSVSEIRDLLGGKIKIDACFLCNPHAFNLFYDYYGKADLHDYLKFYPPQNSLLAAILSKAIDINPDYVIVGNGAIQLIEIILREFTGLKKCIVTPTFSTYYEFDEQNIVYYRTLKEKKFEIDVNDLLNFCKTNNVSVLVLVNPNNPTGTILKKEQIQFIAKELPQVKIVIDESFIDFFDREHRVEKDVYANHNIIVIRSMSKDFGIAGLRLGYAVMSPSFKKYILSQYGLLWNSNGLSHFFIELLNNAEFRNKYGDARDRYISDRERFYEKLVTLKKMTVYKSFANFLILDCGEKIEQVFSELLFEYSIYTRILNDKLHLEPTFIRIACGTNEDNNEIYTALEKIEKTIL